MTMIVMINGSFGVGKTTVANLLIERLPNAVLFDPENVGFLLRETVGRVTPKEDFQDFPQWRKLTIRCARWMRGKGPVVMPMCLWRPEYFTEIRDGLSRFEPELYHFCLTAPAETVHQRLKERGDADDAWSHTMVDRCAKAHCSDLFREHIDTSAAPAPDIVERILTVLRPKTRHE